jgi:lysylphosphatidylglycerol synthetase-like protein (DUF2156 family)
MKTSLLIYLFILISPTTLWAVADCSKTPINKGILHQITIQEKRIKKGSREKIYFKPHKNRIKKRIKLNRYRESSFYGSTALFLFMLMLVMGFASLLILVFIFGGASLLFALIGLWKDENKKSAKRTLYSFLGLAILLGLLISWVLIYAD